MKGTLVPLMARAKKQIAKRAAAREDRSGDRTVATNRRARREYEEKMRADAQMARELAAAVAAVSRVDALHVFPLGAEAATREVAAEFQKIRLERKVEFVVDGLRGRDHT